MRDDPSSSPEHPVYDARTPERLAVERSWTVAPDGDRYRRVVASPEPRSIVELDTLRLLIDAGVLVVCVGGGGIPVALDRDGRLHGVEAVIDKDLAAALLARGLGADALLMLTDVTAVQTDWRTEHARELTDVTTDELRSITFAAGSMGPKVEAACRFAEATGGLAAIGALGGRGRDPRRAPRHPGHARRPRVRERPRAPAGFSRCASPAGVGRSVTMNAWITTYRRDDVLIEVLPGESHSAAWAAVMDPGAASPRACSRVGRGKRRARMAARARRHHASSHHATRASRRSRGTRVSPY